MGALSRAPASSRTHGESRLSRNAAASVTIVEAGATLYGRTGIGEATGPLESPTQGPVAQWLEPAAHNGLVGGSSPPGPTNEISDLLSLVRDHRTRNALTSSTHFYASVWPAALAGRLGLPLTYRRFGGRPARRVRSARFLSGRTVHQPQSAFLMNPLCVSSGRLQISWYGTRICALLSKEGILLGAP